MSRPRWVAFSVAGLLSVGFICPGRVGMPGRLPEPKTAAVTVLTSIQKGQILFATACGDGGYATSLEDLATPPPGTTGAFLGPLVPPLTDSYTIRLSPREGGKGGPLDCHGHPTTTAYYASATPTVRERSRTAFAVSEGGDIWRSDSGQAPTQPFGAPARLVK